MNNKEVIMHFAKLFNISNIDWAKEGFQLKKILNKYTIADLLIALSYWKDKGENVYTLGFFVTNKFKNIKEPLSLYNAAKAMESEVSSSERNRKKFEQNNKTNNREKSYFDLFEEPK